MSFSKRKWEEKIQRKSRNPDSFRVIVLAASCIMIVVETGKTRSWAWHNAVNVVDPTIVCLCSGKEVAICVRPKLHIPADVGLINFIFPQMKRLKMEKLSHLGKLDLTVRLEWALWTNGQKRQGKPLTLSLPMPPWYLSPLRLTWQPSEWWERCWLDHKAGAWEDSSDRLPRLLEFLRWDLKNWQFHGPFKYICLHTKAALTFFR